MASSVTYEFYSQGFGGSLPEPAFTEARPLAEAHVRWLCALRGVDEGSEPFMRAVCAAAEAFAEHGAGEVGGWQIGEFSVKNYASQQTAGDALATAAALRELGPCAAAFAGAR